MAASSLITIDGGRGTGKSRLAAHLRDIFQCGVFEIGPLFRFITWLIHAGHAADLKTAEKVITQSLQTGELVLDLDSGWDMSAMGINFGEGFNNRLLWDPQLDDNLRVVAGSEEGMATVSRIAHIVCDGRNAIIVGRAAGSRFFPYARLKVKLIADSSIRATRKQIQFSEATGSLPTEIERSEPSLTNDDFQYSLVIDTTLLSEKALLDIVSCAIKGVAQWSYPNEIANLQDTLKIWEDTNFPNCQEWELILGVCEEAGELAQCFLKMHRGIKPERFNEEAMRDAVADTVIFLMGLCNRRGWPFLELVAKAGSIVLKREFQMTAERKP